MIVKCTKHITQNMQNDWLWGHENTNFMKITDLRVSVMATSPKFLQDFPGELHVLLVFEDFHTVSGGVR